MIRRPGLGLFRIFLKGCGYLVDKELSVAREKVGFLHRFAAMITADPIITILYWVNNFLDICRLT